MYVAYTRLAPVGSNLTTNESTPPLLTGCSAPAMGKSMDSVQPAAYKLPSPSRATAVTAPAPLPPRYVEYVMTGSMTKGNASLYECTSNPTVLSSNTRYAAFTETREPSRPVW